VSDLVAEFLANGGKIYEAKNGESTANTRLTNFSNKPPAGFQLPSSGYHNVLERRLKTGQLRYVVKVNCIHYGTLPSLDLAVLRRNKVWAKLGITEEDFL
jgi:predicted glycosyl hydrolase (DUF1957 family)